MFRGSRVGPGLGTHQGGVALISVLLVVAVLVAITTRLLTGHNLVVHHHRATFEQNQALQYAYGAETLARQLLFEDHSSSGPGVDHFGEPWARQMTPFELDDIGFMEARIEDLSGCFNLNSLASNDQVVVERSLKRLKRMLRELQVNESLADNIRDWVDADNRVNGFGAEDNTYLGKSPPHRTANRGIWHLSELYLLDLAQTEQVRAIYPYICLLPFADNKININTANSLTLASLADGIGMGSAEAITLTNRAYSSVDEFVSANPEYAAVAEDLTVRSEHFALHVQAVVGDAWITLYSHLSRNLSDGRINVLQRDFAKLFRSSLTTDAAMEAE